MSIPAWQVITWTPFETTVGEFSRLLGQFRHRGASVIVDEPAHGLKHGQVLWALERGSTRIGLAWDWAEVREHVIALADPMKVLSNVTLRRDDGVALPESERLLHLNGAIHGWRWQAHVLGPQPQALPGRLAA